MPTVSFSDEDIKSGFLVQTPGRYNYELTKVKTKAAKTDGSPNYILQFKGLNGEMEGVVVFVQISSKAKWLLAPIFRAANNGEPLEKDKSYEIDDLVGCTFSAMTSRGQSEQGNYFNNLSDWKPVE
jgi:hypothetical protein